MVSTIVAVKTELYKPESHIYSSSVLDNTKPENGTNGLGNIVKRALSTKRNYEYELPEGFPDDLTGKEDPREIVTATYHRFNRLIRVVAARTLSAFDTSSTFDYMDIENLEQNVYIKLLQSYKTYDPGKGLFTTWIGQIAKNVAKDYIRKAISRGQFLTDSLDDNQPNGIFEESENSTSRIASLIDETPDYDPESKLLHSEWLSEAIPQLEHAISILPNEQQNVIVENKLKGLTQLEISSRDGIPLGTVKTRVRLGIRKIQAFMEEYRQTIDSLVE